VIFGERTTPLLEHYRRQGVDVITRTVALQDSPAALWSTTRP